MKTTSLNRRDIADQARIDLEDAPPERIVAWAAHTFGDRLAVASSMADTAVVHVAARAAPGVDVLFLDTGYHFAETIGTRDAVAASYDIKIVNLTPEQTVAEQDATHGKDLFAREPGRCCALRKVTPLRRALEHYDAWITGMRRADGPSRAGIGVIEWDDSFGLVKVNPLARWSDEELDGYMTEHNVIVNPLLFDGYPSVGCAPCTRRVAPGDDPRAGRWAGFAKTECGLHPVTAGTEGTR